MSDWPVSYLGIPYLAGGDTHAGADCWGFFRLVMRERFGHEIPDVGISPDHLRALLAAFSGSALRNAWHAIPLDAATEGDGLLYAHREKWPDHVGIALSGGRVLHCVRGVGSMMEPSGRPLSRGWRAVTAWRRNDAA